MSDYLWDRTGETDAEVERLEKLLGGLRQQPRPLELPPAARVEPSPLRFFRPALAIAATLALMLLAGAWLLASRAVHVEQRQSVVATPPSPAPLAAENEDDKALKTHERARADEHLSEKKVAPRIDRRSADRTNVFKPRRHGAMHERAGVNPRRSRRPADAPREAKAQDGVLAIVMHRQQTAKEQLMYALRLTGAKLNEVQAQVRGADEAEPVKDERNKIR